LRKNRRLWSVGTVSTRIEVKRQREVIKELILTKKKNKRKEKKGVRPNAGSKRKEEGPRKIRHRPKKQRVGLEKHT